MCVYRRWGPWKQEFFSLHSSPTLQLEDRSQEFGVWRNVWLGKISSRVYNRWPVFWRMWVNLPPIRRRTIRQLGKFFPNLK